MIFTLSVSHYALTGLIIVLFQISLGVNYYVTLINYVNLGRPTITLVRGEKKESHNLERGDLFRIPAGTPVYMVNRDENEKLFMVKFLKTISVPGEYEAFYAAGGEDPESFFKAFSPQVLQAAFKVHNIYCAFTLI